ncbi:MAG: DUF4838 domain-containing protein [Clostridia bacterium]|nr:DUF4838 domain-containing protein [Clostridia bacterium]
MKKILAVILTVTLLVGALSVMGSAVYFELEQGFLYDETYVMGDVNDDGGVDGKDSLTLKANVAGLTDYDILLSASDFDADSAASAKDSYALKLVLSGAKRSEDFENGRQVYRLTIAGNDITDYCIVLPTDATEEDNIYFAYLNLMKYVRKATGVELPLAWGSATTEKAIYFNNVKLESELGNELGIEGYKYDVTDGNLNIYGTYRGNMYAVFDILEKYLGFRFYAPSETFIYKSRVVDIPEGTSDEIVPSIVFRFARHTFGRGFAKGHFFANKLNGGISGYDEKFYGSKIGPLYSNAHSFLEYWQMGTGKWPEGSGVPDGMSTEIYDSKLYDAKFKSGEQKDAYGWQPCATSDKEYNILFEGMIDCNRMVMSWGRSTFIAEGQTLFSFSIADNQNYCACRNCRMISKTEGYSGLYLQLYNRATEDAQAYYPGVHLYGIVYAKDFPKTIKPHSNFVILYCGVGCNNHLLGLEECYEGGGQLNNMSNAGDLEALPFWGNLCKETGAQLWFWVYPVTYHYYLSSCPNVTAYYYNLKWLYEEANVTGFFYEGGGTTYNFETLKEYMAVKFMWDPEMTFEEWEDILLEYLYMNYGEGYNELWEYIQMQTEAGDQCGTCFVNNFDRPGDMYSYEYLAENYEYMRGLLLTAYDKALTEDQEDRIETLIVCCDFMGLSSVHTDWYLNGENVELYKTRYTWMYNYITDHNMRVFSSDVYSKPATIDFEINPMIQFYEYGSRRTGIYP